MWLCINVCVLINVFLVYHVWRYSLPLHEDNKHNHTGAKSERRTETTTKRVNDLAAMNELSPDTTQPLDKHKATDRIHERVG